MTVLTSAKNPKIKNLLLLQSKSRERKKQGLFICEGKIELGLLCQAGYEISELYYCPGIYDPTLLSKLQGKLIDPSALFQIDMPIYEKIAYRESTGGIVAIAKSRTHGLTELQLSKNPLVMVVESVEKPGNLGALLRTADAANIDALIVCDPLVDFYNPNVIRSSIGCVFTRQVASSSALEAIEWLKKTNIQLLCTALSASQRYDTIDYTSPTAIVMGTESTGLTDQWLTASNQNIIIPMLGEIDSLNVSVSAAIVVFEAMRQRGFNINS